MAWIKKNPLLSGLQGPDENPWARIRGVGSVGEAARVLENCGMLSI